MSPQTLTRKPMKCEKQFYAGGIADYLQLLRKVFEFEEEDTEMFKKLSRSRTIQVMRY
jgi:hypothetical protein